MVMSRFIENKELYGYERNKHTVDIVFFMKKKFYLFSKNVIYPSTFTPDLLRDSDISNFIEISRGNN